MRQLPLRISPGFSPRTTITIHTHREGHTCTHTFITHTHAQASVVTDTDFHRLWFSMGHPRQPRPASVHEQPPPFIHQPKQAPAFTHTHTSASDGALPPASVHRLPPASIHPCRPASADQHPLASVSQRLPASGHGQPLASGCGFTAHLHYKFPYKVGKLACN